MNIVAPNLIIPLASSFFIIETKIIKIINQFKINSTQKQININLTLIIKFLIKYNFFKQINK